MKRVLSVDIGGLNLILGGGIPVLKRYPDLGESAALLLRGPPGSGKTILGVQLAGSLGRTLECDVAYGCVELLPPELAVQHAGIKREGIAERVLIPEFPTEQPSSPECRIFAATLDIKSSENEQAQLVPAIEGLLAEIESKGGRPRIVVIDSLSDGYHLGASAPRILADELCKMAVQRGLILILLEEITESRPSVWSFATDLVIELGAPSQEIPSGASDPFERRMKVVKNRFGPSEPADHRFAILPRSGVRVLPHPRAYLPKWAAEIVLANCQSPRADLQGWLPGLSAPQGWPTFRDCVTAIVGMYAHHVYPAAMRVGTATIGNEHFTGTDIILDFGGLNRVIHPAEISGSENYFVPCGDPFLSGDWLLSTIVAELEEQFRLGRFIRRVLIGDLQTLRNILNPSGVWHALVVLLAILRRIHVPAILFESSLAQDSRLFNFSAADVSVRADSDFKSPISLMLYERRSGLTAKAELP